MSAGTPNSKSKVHVNLGDRSYDIHVAAGLLDGAADCLRTWIENRHVVVISDENVAALYLERFEDEVGEMSRQFDSIVVPAGESSKSVAQADQLWQKMVSIPADRSTVIVALGGGVVGDLAGFIAATFGRGIDFLQVPTSLLSQVDSSVGGKVGINLPTAKNMVGAFLQPKAVLIDPKVLSTLDDRNYVAGLAEVIKYGLIMDEPLFEFIEQSIDSIKRLDFKTLSELIVRCCQCKADVVEADETERSGRRAILNYGHTYGHAIESVFGYGTFLHGEAISIGMTCAARIAKQLGMVDQAFCERQKNLFQAFGLPIECPVDQHDAIVQAMHRDKKVSNGQLNLILPTQMGHVESVPAPDDALILESLNHSDL